MVNVVKGLPVGWGVCSRTIPLSSYRFTLSHHSNSIAVGSQSRDIIILNAITGGQSAVLSGHTEQVICAVFSSDGISLVSGSSDKTVKLWDIQTGGVVKTFSGHSKVVWSVSISANSTMIASGSDDATICLWNIQTGDCCHTIQQQQTVYSVMFSPQDPQHLISISDDKVWQWDVNGCQIRPPFDSSHAAFSSDGAQFVSCFKKTITVHNSSSGAIVTEFQPAGDSHQCCLSPDSRLVAVAVGNTAYCWDITTSEPQLVETFIGHTSWITSLVFSSSTTLISGSHDNSVKFWQIVAQLTDPAIIDLEPTPLLSAPIRSTTLHSKEAIAITCDQHGVIKAWDIPTGICRTYQTPAKDYKKLDIHLVNGRLMFIWYRDNRIHVWDAENGELLWEVDKPWSDIEDLRISGDGSRVFGLYAPYIWAWSLHTGEVVFQLSGRFANPVCVQCDDSHLVAGYQSGEVLILDLTNVK